MPSIRDLENLQIDVLSSSEKAVRGLLESLSISESTTMPPRVYKALASGPFLELCNSVFGAKTRDSVQDRFMGLGINMEYLLRSLIGAAISVWALNGLHQAALPVMRATMDTSSGLERQLEMRL